jgi:hypothetical protein
MKLRRTVCGAMFAVSTLGLVMLDVNLLSGQPGGFGKGGGREFKFGGQPPGGGRDMKFGGQAGGGKNPFTDPETVFNFYSKGGDVIDFSRMDPNMKAFAKRGFEKAGLPPPTDTTVISKAQFVDSFNRALASKGMTPGGPPTPAAQPMSFRAGGDNERSRGFGGPPPGGSYGGPPPGGYSGFNTTNSPGNSSNNYEREKMSGPTTFRMTDQDIERKFNESDANRDGKLSPDEVSDRSPLKASFKESDTNGDGYIDLAEYKAYIAVRIGGEGADPSQGSYGSYAGNGNYGRDRDLRNDKKEELPVAIRFGKLPAGLPSWWDTLDTDRDGQVGLYEWRVDGREVKEFQRMDLDGDGLLSPQEWLRFNTLSAEQAKAIAAEEEIGGSSGSSGAKSSRPSFGSGPPSFGGGTKGGPPSGGRDSRSSEKGSERDTKNPFRTGGKR